MAAVRKPRWFWRPHEKFSFTNVMAALMQQDEEARNPSAQVQEKLDKQTQEIKAGLHRVYTEIDARAQKVVSDAREHTLGKCAKVMKVVQEEVGAIREEVSIAVGDLKRYLGDAVEQRITSQHSLVLGVVAKVKSEPSSKVNSEQCSDDGASGVSNGCKDRDLPVNVVRTPSPSHSVSSGGSSRASRKRKNGGGLRRRPKEFDGTVP